MEKSASTAIAEVLMNHITSLMAGKIEAVMHNFTDDSVVMSIDKTFHGLAEIRAFFQAAIDNTPPESMAAVTVIRQDIYNEVAYVVYKAEPYVKIATGTWVFRDGKIIAMTEMNVLN